MDEDGNIESINRAVDQVSMNIAPGEFIAILGHNGSGKSTFAKHLNVLLTPTEGTLYINGKNTKDVNKLCLSNVNLNIKIDYVITPIFDKGVFDRIVYEFNWHNITLVKGILTKFDITTTLPYLESLNADYYAIVMDHIISGIIADLHEKLGIEIDEEELCNENVVLFESFISELKTNVKDIQTMLKSSNK